MIDIRTLSTLVKFSERKTKAINVSFKQAQVRISPFVFNNSALEKVKNHKHLGITFTKQPRFDITYGRFPNYRCNEEI